MITIRLFYAIKKNKSNEHPHKTQLVDKSKGKYILYRFNNK